MALCLHNGFSKGEMASAPPLLGWIVRALIVFLLVHLSPSSGQTQTAHSDTIYSRQAYFRIPFQTEGNDRRLQEVQLWVSEDQGLTWRPAGSVAPDQRGFNFRAERDGLYWFAVRTIELDGRAQPPTLQGARPGLKVAVDTRPPIITLRQGNSRDGALTIEWDIQDDNLDLSSLALDYHIAGGTDWIPLSIEPAATGQRYWNAESNSPVEVRLRARDLAKNEAEQKLTLTPGGGSARPSTSFGEADHSSARTTIPGTRWVNSKRISLNYKIDDQGPSGVSAVEIWFTRDGKTWEKYREDPNPTPPCVFDVQDEGVYGFTLVVRSGVGLSDRPPRNGDAPQVWVQVDITKPVVHWVNVDVGRGPETSKVTITWKVTDDNLARQPITLSYAKITPTKEQRGPLTPEGQWTQIAANLENTGRYVWQMPPDVPYSFMVRLEAADKAGNVGAAEYPKPVLVDLHQPKSSILSVDPAGK